MYKIKNLKYKDILNIKDLHLPKGNTTIISGRSGLGKSTLFSLLTGKDYEYEGDITLKSMSIKNVHTNKIFKHISFLGQDNILLGQTIEEEFKIICDLLDVKYDSNFAKKLLKIVDLEQFPLDCNVTKFSGGQKQRLCIARTLYPQKEVILLDEPTSALDHTTTDNLINNLNNYITYENKTLILISHNENIIQNKNFVQIDLGDYNE